MPIILHMESQRFRLERVRALREQRESEAKQKLAGAIAREMECEARLASTAAEINGARSAQRAQAATLTGSQLRGQQDYLERLERVQQQVSLELHKRTVETEKRRGALRHASADRQALERLKAKTLAEQQRQRDRAEQTLLDEIAGVGHHRRAA